MKNSQLKVIVTGATGMVGEGVLLECLENPAIQSVLSVSRKPYGLEHPKLSECLVQDFMKLDTALEKLKGYDACFYCAGVSSVGMNEADYTRVTYDVTMHFAETLQSLNPEMVFIFVTGSHTDSSEKGSSMWARVKGRTENALGKLGFLGEYNFRPGYMKPTQGQKNIKTLIKMVSFMDPLLRAVVPGQVLTLHEVAVAMIHCVTTGYPTSVLEIKDIKTAALAETGASAKA